MLRFRLEGLADPSAMNDPPPLLSNDTKERDWESYPQSRRPTPSPLPKQIGGYFLPFSLLAMIPMMNARSSITIATGIKIPVLAIM